MKQIQRAVHFSQDFYPAWRRELSESDSRGLALDIHFPKGVIRFCKEDLLGTIQALHENFSAIKRD